MIQLIYVSSAVRPFTREELAALLAHAREKNQRLNITGMLLYKGGNLLQVLEGEEDVVRSLMDTIEADPRHTGTSIISEETIDHRLFGDWSMAFRDLADPQVQSMPGYSKFMHGADLDQFPQDATGCLDVLKFFRDSR